MQHFRKLDCPSFGLQVSVQREKDCPGLVWVASYDLATWTVPDSEHCLSCSVEMQAKLGVEEVEQGLSRSDDLHPRNAVKAELVLAIFYVQGLSKFISLSGS